MACIFLSVSTENFSSEKENHQGLYIGIDFTSSAVAGRKRMA